MAQDRLVTPPAAAMARHLPALAARLRAAGYRVGPSERIAIERLLARAALAGRWPLEPAVLGRILAPVVCHSAAEQRGFGAHFEAWLATLTPASRKRAARRAHEERVEPEPAQPARRGVSWWRLVAATLLLVILALGVRWWFLTTQTDPMAPDATQVVARVRSGEGSGARAPGRLFKLVTQDLQLWPVALAVSLWLIPLYYAWLYGGLLPAWLTRRSASALPVLDRLALGQPARSLGAAWRGLLRLGDRDLRPDTGLHVDATVRATILKGGYFTPVYGRRPELPEYLALIDRLSPEDHLARFATELVARLEERGLATRTFFFSNDPRRGVGGAGHGYSSLPALAGRAAGERLLVFGDAGSWLDPKSGRPWPGLATLARWRRRFLLTPLPATEWGRREELLADGWLAPVPLSEPGLDALAEHFASGVLGSTWPEPAPTSRPATGATDGGGRYPWMLAKHPERWLAETTPTPGMVRELLESLAAYLGEDGSRWLRACAVFPVVSWPVTVSLGQRMTSPAGRPLLNEERLLALSRLPWFRHGRMPPWLRLELVDAMGSGEREQARRRLRELLADALPDGSTDGELEVAQLADDGWLRRTLTRQGKDSPLRDYLFLTFMRGRRPSRITLAAPRGLRTLIRDSDRWSVLASAALAFLGTLAVAVWHRVQTLPIPQQASFDDLPSTVPIPSATSFPEGAFAVISLLLGGLLIAFQGRSAVRPPAPAAESAVPRLIERISARRWPVLGPWVITNWTVAFILTDFAGSPPDARWVVASLAALATLGLYFVLERGMRGGHHARLEELAARLETGAEAEAVSALLAFLRGPAPDDLKRRGLRLLYAKVREPSGELLGELEVLRQVGTLEPRTRNLLRRIASHLEERHRAQDEGASP